MMLRRFLSWKQGSTGPMTNPTAKFCFNCGTPLPPGAKFCPECGTSMQALAGTGAPAAAPAPAAPQPTAPPPAAKTTPATTGEPAGERRQVTILFIDLTGYTKLSNELGAEPMHALLQRFFAHTDGIIANYGGTVDKHIGDAVMAVFGAPVAHDNDPERAVRAAIAVHSSMKDLSAETGRELSVHIGIASGRVVASGSGSDSHREYTVTGESVNLASRLQEMAKGGESYISDAVHRATHRLISARAMGEVSVKGFDDPISVYQLLGFADTESGGETRTFVGRQSEMRKFRGTVEDCVETGHGEIVYILGEIGIGKTTLLKRFAAIAHERGLTVHETAVYDFGVGKGQDAIGALARRLLGIPRGAAKEARREAAEQALADGLCEPSHAAFINTLIDVPQPANLRAMFDALDHEARQQGRQAALAALIAGTAVKSPLLITVDDIHWAGEDVLGDLAVIASVVARNPVVLVLTARRGGDPLDQTWHNRIGDTAMTTMNVGPLAEVDAKALAEAHIAKINQYTLDCIERAAGNPLFLEQLLINAQTMHPTDVPDSVQSIVLARLDRLDAEDKRALLAASVIGQRFSLDILRHMIGSPNYHCAGLVENFLVREDGSDYVFANALTRDGAYESLLQSNRRELHCKAAAWYKGRDTLLHAQHLERGGDARAGAAYLAAARELTDQYRHDQALSLLNRALELAQTAEKFEIARFKGETLHAIGRGDEAVEAYRDAEALAADEVARCDALIGQAAGLRLIGGRAEAMDLLATAEAIAEAAGLKAQLAQIHNHRGNLLFAEGDRDGCLAEQKTALDFAERAEAPEWQAHALSGLGDAYYARGKIATAHDYFNRSLELCRTLEMGALEAANRNMILRTWIYRNEWDAATDECRSVSEAAKQTGNRRIEMFARLAMGWACTETADFDAALASFDTTIALARELKVKRTEAIALFYLARCRYFLGERETAADLARQAVHISRETGMGFCGPGTLGMLALASDSETERNEALAEGLAILERGCLGHNYFWLHRDAMESYLERRDWHGVERHATALAEFTAEDPLPYATFYIERARAIAAIGQNPADESARAELKRVRDYATATNLKAAMAAIERATTET
jgi:class 3 adenylate cyclase/tetratricopeptide (TPR) repeat protein